MHNFSIDLFVAIEIGGFEKVNFVVVWRVEVLHFECHMSPFVIRAVACLDFCHSFSRKFLCNIKKFFLNIQNGTFLVKNIVIEILHEELREDMEVLFIIFKNLFDEIVDFVDMREFKLILVDQSHNLKNLLLEHLFDADRLSTLGIVDLTKVRLKILDKVL